MGPENQLERNRENTGKQHHCHAEKNVLFSKVENAYLSGESIGLKYKNATIHSTKYEENFLVKFSQT